MLTVDAGSRNWSSNGLAVTMEAATSLARGDYAFSEYEFKYLAHKDYVRDQYCGRCKGTGNWSEKKPSSRRCPTCEIDQQTGKHRLHARQFGSDLLPQF
jgi:hypothetical protein